MQRTHNADGNGDGDDDDEEGKQQEQEEAAHNGKRELILFTFHGILLSPPRISLTFQQQGHHAHTHTHTRKKAFTQ